MVSIEAAKERPETRALIHQPAKLLLNIPLHHAAQHTAHGFRVGLPRAAGGCFELLQAVFQHIVDKRTRLRRGEPRLPAGLGAQAVLHEKREPAGIKTVDARGGQVDRAAVQPVDCARVGQRAARKPAVPRSKKPFIVLVLPIGRFYRWGAAAAEVGGGQLDRGAFPFQAVEHRLPLPA